MMKIYIEKNKTSSEIFRAERVSQPSLLATVVMTEIISPSCQPFPPSLKLSPNMYSIGNPSLNSSERKRNRRRCCLFIHVCNFIHPRPCNHSLVSLFVCCFTALLLQRGACSLGLKHCLFLPEMCLCVCL